MTEKEEKDFKEKIKKDCNAMAMENNKKWGAFSLFLDAEFGEGKIDFRLHINEDRSFYIYPLGIDGKTFDGVID